MYLDYQYEMNIMCYNYFTIETRFSLKNLLQIKSQKGLIYRAMANLLNMFNSTVAREANDNGGVQLYDPHLANIKSIKNKSDCGRKYKLTEKIKPMLDKR